MTTSGNNFKVTTGSAVRTLGALAATTLAAGIVTSSALSAGPDPQRHDTGVHAPSTRFETPPGISGARYIVPVQLDGEVGDDRIEAIFYVPADLLAGTAGLRYVPSDLVGQGGSGPGAARYIVPTELGGQAQLVETVFYVPADLLGGGALRFVPADLAGDGLIEIGDARYIVPTEPGGGDQLIETLFYVPADLLGEGETLRYVPADLAGDAGRETGEARYIISCELRGTTPDRVPGRKGALPVRDEHTLDLDAPTCPGDVNRDGAVDVTDMMAVLAAWGKCRRCRADFDGDDDVDFDDLIIVAVAWGMCR